MNVFLSEKKVFIKYKAKRLVTFLLLFLDALASLDFKL